MSPVGYAVGYGLVSVVVLCAAMVDASLKTIDLHGFLMELADGPHLLALLNALVAITAVSNFVIQALLFGGLLRVIESEHLAEQMPVFIINMLFNLATNDLNIILNCVILSVAFNFKFFHVLVMDRLDFKLISVVSDDNRTKSTSLRALLVNIPFTLLPIMGVIDWVFAKFLVYDVFQGINLITCLLFGFLFAVLGQEMFTYLAKYAVNIYEVLYDINDDIDQESTWENKVYYMKSIDILSAVIRTAAHVIFTYLLIFHSGVLLPILMIQGTYSALRSLYSEVCLIKLLLDSQKRLNKHLLNATEEDLNSDNVCIICMDEMYTSEQYAQENGQQLPSGRVPKKLVCLHMLHMGCLKSWMESSLRPNEVVCPLCRRRVFDELEQAPAVNIQNDGNGAAHGNGVANGNGVVNENGAQNQDIPAPENNVQRENVLIDESPRETIAGRAPIREIFGEKPENFENMTNEGEQILHLANAPVKPRGWVIVPLEKSGSDYTVRFSVEKTGTLKVV